MLIQVKKFQNFRRTLPEEGSHMYICKNNLLKIAAGNLGDNPHALMLPLRQMLKQSCPTVTDTSSPLTIVYQALKPHCLLFCRSSGWVGRAEAGCQGTSILQSFLISILRIAKTLTFQDIYVGGVF